MLRTAVIGAGTMGALYARAFHESPHAELVAVADLDETRAEEVAAGLPGARAYPGVEAVLDATELDAAAVSLPDYAHRDVTLTLLAAGVHVLCEKPLATTVDDCADIVRAAEASSGSLMVNYGNRHRPEARLLRDRVRAGDLGRLQTVVMKGNEKLLKTRQLAWRDRTDPTWFLISHLVDFVSWVTGERFADVYGRRSACEDEPELPVPTGHSYLGTLAGGAVVNLGASWILPSGAPAAGDMAIELIGTRGYARVDFMERPVVRYDERASHLPWDFAEDHSGRLSGWWITSCDYFLDSVARGRHPEPDAAEGAETSLVLVAMHRSLDDGRAVPVDEVRAEFSARVKARE